MTVQLPALRGDDSLGFLAAVGIMALAEYGEIAKARLSWSVAAVPIAILEGPQSREQLADDLRLALDRLRTRKAAIPGLPADIPLVGGNGPDPMRMPREELAERYNDAEAAWLSSPSNPWWGRWLIALAAQSAVKESGGAKAGRSHPLLCANRPVQAPQLALRQECGGRGQGERSGRRAHGLAASLELRRRKPGCAREA